MVRICLQTCMNACVPYNNILWILVVWFFQNSASLLLLLAFCIGLFLLSSLHASSKQHSKSFSFVMPFCSHSFYSIQSTHEFRIFAFRIVYVIQSHFSKKKNEEKKRSRWYILWFYVNTLSSILYKIWFIHDSLGMHFGFYRKIILQQIENAYANKLHHHIQFHFQEPHGSTKCLLLCY